MRSFRHWTPRYIINRIRLILDERRYPANPWLTHTAVSFLDGYLRPDSDVGIEWGSGRSTVWFSKRLLRLTSVEHHKGWFDKIQERLNKENRRNVDYCFSPMANPDHPTHEELRSYLAPADEFADSSIDFALIDGIVRDHCALKIVPKIRPGGLLVVDNVNWYLPCESLAPASQRLQNGARTQEWAEFLSIIGHWRRYWTSNGITDTAMFFKPTRE